MAAAGSTCRGLGIPRGKGMLTPADLPALSRSHRRAGADVRDRRHRLDRLWLHCGGIHGRAAARRRGRGGDFRPDRQAGGDDGERDDRRPAASRRAPLTVVTPYLDLVNERLTAFIEASDISVEMLASFRAQTVDALAAITPGQIVDLARAAMSPRSDAMFIACSQLPTRAITRRSRARVRPAGLVVDTRDGVGRRKRDGVIRDK